MVILVLKILNEMTKNKLVIYGASDFAEVVTTIIKLTTDYEIIGYLDDNPDRIGVQFMESKVLGGIDLLQHLKNSGVENAVIGFGDCKGRLYAGNKISEIGLKCVTLIHPAATISDRSKINEGALIMAGAVIDPFVQIGSNTIINKNCVIGHHTQIGTAVHIASGVCTGGNCKIEDGAFVGIGANILNNIKIGASSIVGAGSLVNKHVPESSTVWGVPAKIKSSPNLIIQ